VLYLKPVPWLIERSKGCGLGLLFLSLNSIVQRMWSRSNFPWRPNDWKSPDKAGRDLCLQPQWGEVWGLCFKEPRKGQLCSLLLKTVVRVCWQKAG